eukprot:m.225434 g.225434  ORF g.225434 m.225434 type:complete len:71 (+) comp15158_c1_seq1:1398-1610(+)
MVQRRFQIDMQMAISSPCFTSNSNTEIFLKILFALVCVAVCRFSRFVLVDHTRVCFHFAVVYIALFLSFF